MLHPLRLHTFETKPKEVIYPQSYFMEVPLDCLGACIDGLKEIFDAVEAGRLIADKFYRKGRLTNIPPDDLLQRAGIMHLHPGGPSTSEILYVMQFASLVIPLEVSNHNHLDHITPRGAALLIKHEESITYRLQEYERAKKDAQRQLDQARRARDDIWRAI